MPIRTGYNDAWETSGWTAQNMAYPPPFLNTLDYPLDIDLVTITGHIRDGDGGRANGWFEIDNGKTVLKHTVVKEWIRPIKKRVEIREGVFSVTVPATDATVLSSDAPWGYHIRISVAGRPFLEGWEIALPKATPLVDAFDLDYRPASEPGIVLGGSDTGGFSLGAEPGDLTVNLTTGADFNSTLTNAEGWATATVSVVFANGTTWVADIDGVNATFAVDKAQADAIPSGTKAKLVVTSGSLDEVWAVGKVARHD